MFDDSGGRYLCLNQNHLFFSSRSFSFCKVLKLWWHWSSNDMSMTWWLNCWTNNCQIWAGQAGSLGCRGCSARWQAGTCTWDSPQAQGTPWVWTWSQRACRMCWISFRMTSLTWMSLASQVRFAVLLWISWISVPWITPDCLMLANFSALFDC